MENRLNFKILSILVLLTIILILYINFILADLSIIRCFSNTSVIKYLSIILCFSISLMIGKDHLNSIDKLLLQLGLFITLIADFLLIIAGQIVIGVGVFSIAHIIYVIRYKRRKIRFVLLKFLAVLLLLVITYVILNYFVKEIEILFLVALFYTISLLSSVINSINAYKQNLLPYPNKLLISVGMLLFLLCDINVGLFNITNMFYNFSGISHQLHNISMVLIWFFYLPSQVLLSLSGYDFKQLFKNKKGAHYN